MSATETSPPSGQAPPPFESLDALREAHADLRRRSRFSDNAPAFLARRGYNSDDISRVMRSVVPQAQEAAESNLLSK